LQKGFGGNAADVETDAAKGGAFFDAGDGEAELGGADGADIATWAGADDDDVE
jgi:hypothetical protein